jgi:Calcineurin-like phosphoesterase
VLHINDMHVDMNPGTMERLAALVPDMRYDVCVLTGDFRGATCGPFEPALNGLAEVHARVEGPVFAVLGNHDTIRMVPAPEEALERGGAHIYLAGIDVPTSIASTTSRRPRRISPRARSRSCCRIPRKSTGRRPMRRSAARRPHPWRSDLPAGIDAIAAMGQLEEEGQQLERQWTLRRERARYEAERHDGSMTLLSPKTGLSRALLNVPGKTIARN